MGDQKRSQHDREVHREQRRQQGLVANRQPQFRPRYLDVSAAEQRQDQSTNDRANVDTVIAPLFRSSRLFFPAFI